MTHRELLLMKLNDYLKEYRISQKQFASAINVAPATVNRWIFEKRTPSLKKVFEIKKATKNIVDLEDWIDG